jgi:hypothetical protein
MAAEVLPDNPEPEYILQWISESFHMSMQGLAWMFQTRKETIRSWIKGGNISSKNRLKLRKSYYFLNGRVDPNMGNLYCAGCTTWKPVQEFRNGHNRCKKCEG